MLIVFVVMSVLIMCGKLPSAVAQSKTALSAFSSHSLNIFGSKLMLGLSLIRLSAHANDDIAISSIFAEEFSFLALLLLEVISIAGLKIGV